MDKVDAYTSEKRKSYYFVTGLAMTFVHNFRSGDTDASLREVKA